jgi:hypothetical protein
MYIVIESSPNNQIPSKLFASINSTDIYILSYKFVMNGPMSMEVRLNTFPLFYDDVISILNILKEFWAMARYHAPPGHVQKMSQ